MTSIALPSVVKAEPEQSARNEARPTSLTEQIRALEASGHQIQHVYAQSKQPGTYNFRISNHRFRDKPASLCMGNGVGRNEHVACRECLLSCMGRRGAFMSNLPSPILDYIRHDLQLVAPHLQRRPDEVMRNSLNFVSQPDLSAMHYPESIHLYRDFLAKRDDWCQRLRDKGILDEAEYKLALQPHISWAGPPRWREGGVSTEQSPRGSLSGSGHEDAHEGSPASEDVMNIRTINGAAMASEYIDPHEGDVTVLRDHLRQKEALSGIINVSDEAPEGAPLFEVDIAAASTSAPKIIMLPLAQHKREDYALMRELIIQEFRLGNVDRNLTASLAACLKARTAKVASGAQIDDKFVENVVKIFIGTRAAIIDQLKQKGAYVPPEPQGPALTQPQKSSSLRASVDVAQSVDGLDDDDRSAPSDSDGLQASVDCRSGLGFLLWVEQRIPKLVVKVIPVAGESSRKGVSKPWCQIKALSAKGQLGGISPHQGSATSYTISIPNFNTTLSRVDKQEIAAVIEVLLALTNCKPRNCDAEVHENIRKDLAMMLKDSNAESSAARIHFSDESALVYPDMREMYEVVLTRLPKWAGQIRKRTSQNPGAGRGRGGWRGRGRGRSYGTKRPSGALASDMDPSAKRTTHPRGAKERAPRSALDWASDDEDSGAVGMAEADNGSGGGGGGVGNEKGYTSKPSRATMPAMPYSIAVPAPHADHQEAQHTSRTLRVETGSTLPPFPMVEHVFKNPQRHLVEFEGLISKLRRCVLGAAQACGYTVTWSEAAGRFCKKWVEGLTSEKTLLDCVSVYSSMHEHQTTSQWYQVLEAVELYLGE